MAEIKQQQPKKKSGLKKWLVGGTLTAIAAGVFIVSPGFHTPGNAGNTTAPTSAKIAQNIAANANVQVADQENIYPAVTKDFKTVSIELTVPVLSNKGSPVMPQVFAAGLKGFMTVNVMQEASKYNAAEIPGKIDDIQKGLSKFLADNMILGVDANRQPVRAQEGVNFGRPQIKTVKDAATGQVLWQAKTGPLAKLGL